MPEYRTGSNWGVTIVRRGTGPDLQDCFRREDDQLVAVVMNGAFVTGDQELAERVCELLNGGEAVQLLEYALQLRIHGERAPGGNERWAEFDRRCEDFLRRQLGCKEAP